MRLRHADYDDMDLLFRWRQQDEEGDWWQGDRVTKEKHRGWLMPRLFPVFPALVDLWIVEMPHRGPVGQVRCDSNGEISISIDKDHRRRGYALRALKLATELAFKKHGRVKACVDASNLPALELFEKAGYVRKDVVFFRYPG